MIETGPQYGDEAIMKTTLQPLEVWSNPSPHDYLIHIEHPEFTALCPRSGYPDFEIIVFEYYSGEWVVELKAFKLYINSFRQERIGHEAVTNKIADRLFTDVKPKATRVIGDFMRRGNVKTIITVCRGQLMDFPEYRANIL